MDNLYKKIKAEILEDHKRNNYMQAYRMPLRDKDDLENYQRYKKGRKQE